MELLTSIASRIFFIAAFVFGTLATLEKLANIIGYSLLGTYSPWRLLEFAIVSLIFVIALQLRDLKITLKSMKNSSARGRDIITERSNFDLERHVASTQSTLPNTSTTESDDLLKTYNKRR